MKIEIEKSEYDRLKSREEKLMAYYEWFVDKENDLETVEDIVNKNIELEEENKKLKEYNGELIENHKKDIAILCEENKKLKEELEKWKDTVKTLNEYNKFRIAENKKLKEELKDFNKLIGRLERTEEKNKKLREELSAYDREYFDGNKKANTIFMEEDTLQELRDLGEI